ncbi:MAG: Holliday junction branch migration protein RuvA [Bacteroidales bacterium]|nr:Holliday junction branch migration protein RuvA [Bacteroidales bacterium]MBQ2912881.1 Holliday junction branch migration protein RuvA [Bacteroidales bacterium]MBQ7017414.1 Holliday junction branch migration protein RuvA [Bacteroidales bacterium]
MYTYIKGELTEITPTAATIENNGIGYELQISLQTFAEIQGLRDVMLYIHHHIREDVEMWYGFATKEERSIFRMLIEVNGIGPNTARMMLSSMNSTEIKTAIISGDVNRIKSIKGIGIKTAQRVIIDLKDKIAKGGEDVSSALFVQETTSANMEEALSALVMLGFAKSAAEKVLKSVYKENPQYTLEELIKFSLKRL